MIKLDIEDKERDHFFVRTDKPITMEISLVDGRIRADVFYGDSPEEPEPEDFVGGYHGAHPEKTRTSWEWRGPVLRARELTDVEHNRLLLADLFDTVYKTMLRARGTYSSISEDRYVGGERVLEVVKEAIRKAHRRGLDKLRGQSD